MYVDLGQVEKEKFGETVTVVQVKVVDVAERITCVSPKRKKSFLQPRVSSQRIREREREILTSSKSKNRNYLNQVNYIL